MFVCFSLIVHPCFLLVSLPGELWPPRVFCIVMCIYLYIDRVLNKYATATLTSVKGSNGLSAWIVADWTDAQSVFFFFIPLPGTRKDKLFNQSVMDIT